MGRIIGQPPLAGTRPASRYPWGEWTDGSWWEIEKGADFAVSIPAMRSMLYGKFGSSGPLKPEIRLDAPARTATRIYFRFVPRE